MVYLRSTLVADMDKDRKKELRKLSKQIVEQHSAELRRDLASRNSAPFGSDEYLRNEIALRQRERSDQGQPAPDADLLARLCPELRILLDAELAAGNRVVETFGGWPVAGAVFVMLAEPFRKRSVTLPADVVFREINDPHWWKAEYDHEPTHHVLACRF